MTANRMEKNERCFAKPPIFRSAAGASITMVSGCFGLRPAVNCPDFRIYTDVRFCFGYRHFFIHLPGESSPTKE